MTMHVRISGVWKEIFPAHVRVSGDWKEITQGWVNISGTWKQFYQSILVTLVGGGALATSTSPANASAQWRLTNAGAEQRGINGSFTTVNTWLIAGAAGDYEARMTMNSGDNFTGSALGTWLSLASTLLWTLLETTDGAASKSGTGTLEIRRASTGEVLATASVALTATVNI